MCSLLRTAFFASSIGPTGGLLSPTPRGPSTSDNYSPALPRRFCPRSPPGLYSILRTVLSTFSLLKVPRTAVMSTALDICAQKRVVLRLPSVRGNNPSIDIEMLESFLKYSGRDIDEKFRHFTHFQPPSSSHFLVIFDMDYQQNPNPNLNEMSHEVYNIKFDNNEPYTLSSNLSYSN